MKARVAILGATGYGGGELLRLLLLHPYVDIVAATSRTEAGRPVSAVHRNLEGVTALKFSAPDNDFLADATDVVFSAMPHGATAEAIAPLVDRGVRVIDLSGDFRLRDADSYRRAYKRVHPRPDLLGHAAYGCPELRRDVLRRARFVACPGCFATAINLALLPAAARGWLEGATVTVTAMTGSSGSGAEASEGTHHPTRAQTLRPYKVLDHQHVPEVVMTLGDAGGAPAALHFTPVSAPIVRGILAVATAPLPPGVDESRVQAEYAEFYAAAPFVRVLTGREAECATVATTNFAEIRSRARDGLLHVTSAIDNLVKGAGGQAVQCMNLMMGFPEPAGLEWPGTWP